MAAHGEPGGAQGYPLVVHVGRGACGGRMLPPTGIEGDDGGDGFGLDKLIDAVGIEATVIDDCAHGGG